MSLRIGNIYSEKDAALLNGLQLAYLGDTVWETIIRDMLIHQGLNVHHLHRNCVQYVNAHSQAVFISLLAAKLTETENEIYKRGRNAHAHHPAPKNQNPEDYAAATGFEALIGYLYLTGQEERIMQLAKTIVGGSIYG